MSQVARQTLLEYYREHQITPVRYDMSSIDAHLERRSSLYTKLGLPPLVFKNANVLEVAAGTGHNSLYLAQCLPTKLTLLEPNISGVDHIYEAYKTFPKLHTIPTIENKTLEEFSPSTLFDVVLCENWLGTPQHEQVLLQKLSNLVTINGMLVVTSVSPIGIAPNIIRRFMSPYLSPISDSFVERTNALVTAFEPHLKTMAAMTRSSIDWVQDNMMNPAYFTLCLTMPDLIERLGDRFDIVGTSPVFAEDWRWFKSMHGDNREFNAHFLSEYWKKAHNFFDHRETPMAGDAEANMLLEKNSLTLLAQVTAHEDALIKFGHAQTEAANVLAALKDFINALPAHFTAAIDGLQEAYNLISNTDNITIEAVSAMSKFNSVFGRETSYVSMLRTNK